MGPMRGGTEEGALPLGSSTHSIDVGGLNRGYRVYVPAGLGKNAPLVVMLHGGYGSARQAERSYGWDKLADENHFVVVYPDGRNHAWNAAGGCCGTPAAEHVDDVSFITATVDAVQSDVSVDPKRIYAAGMSNGAMMSYRLACETDIFAAIGPVSGTINIGYTCSNPKAVSVMAVHGRSDTRVLYDGGTSTVGSAHISAESQLALHDFWRSVDSCSADVTTVAEPRVARDASCPDGRGVTLVTINGYGHEWPMHSSASLVAGDKVYTGWDATSALWQFFASHPKP
jgi:polyhydroxybutyrate depolymerase